MIMRNANWSRDISTLGSLPKSNRASTQEQMQAVIDRLKPVADDVISKLAIAGFWKAPVEHGGFDQL